MSQISQTTRSHINKPESEHPPAPRESMIAPRRPSARAERQQRREDGFCAHALQAVFSSSGPDEVAEKLAENVWTAKGFASLQRYRREYVRGYSDGILDTIARLAGHKTAKQLTPPRPVRVPRWVKRLQPDASWHRHAYGGGWVASTAHVDPTAYVGPRAAVFGQARVIEHARVYGDARVCEHAEMHDHAQLHGQSVIGSMAELRGIARVHGASLISGTCQLEDGVWSNVQLDRTPEHREVIEPSALAEEAADTIADLLSKAREIYERTTKLRA